MIAFIFSIIQLSQPVLIKTDGGWSVFYSSDAVRTNSYWHVEESSNLTDWFPILYDDSVTNISLVNMGPSTFVRLVGEPVQ